MKSYSLITAPLLLILLCFIPSSQSPARQSYLTSIPPDAQALSEIDFDDGGSITYIINADGSSDEVGLQPGQTVSVTASFATFPAGDTVIIEPLDGGCVLDDNGACQDQSANQTIVQSDGTISFTFQVGNDPGVSQISLHDGNAEIGLKFWIIDPNDTVNVPVGISENSTDNAMDDSGE